MCKISGTFKNQKVSLKKENYDPSKIDKDAVYVLLPNTSKYQMLTPEIYQKIQNKEYRF